MTESTPKEKIIQICKNFDPNDPESTLIEQVNDILELGEEILKSEPELDPELTIGNFLDDIAGSVIDAQIQIDALSREYSANRRAVASSTTFRIPRVEAAIHFDFKQVDATGTRLSLRRATAERSFEHEISFEVIAVPPPVEVVQIIAANRPWGFVVDLASVRDMLIARLKSPKLLIGGPEYEVLRALEAGVNRHNLVVLRIEDDLHVLMGSRMSVGGKFWIHGVIPPEGPITLVSGSAGHLHHFFETILGGTRNWKDIHGLVKKVQAAVDNSNAELAKALEALDDAVPEASSPLSRILTQIAESVVEAQQALDARSDAYLAAGPLVPTAFRIPSVHAKLAFEFSASRRKRIKAKIRKRRDTQSNDEQRVAFDIVAAPPDPKDARMPCTSGRIAFMCVESRSERERLRTQIEAELAKHHDDALERSITAERFANARILCNGEQYIVLVRDAVNPARIYAIPVDPVRLLNLDVQVDAKLLPFFEGWLPS